jgi:hypothetical protein
MNINIMNIDIGLNNLKTFENFFRDYIKIIKKNINKMTLQEHFKYADTIITQYKFSNNFMKRIKLNSDILNKAKSVNKLNTYKKIIDNYNFDTEKLKTYEIQKKMYEDITKKHIKYIYGFDIEYKEKYFIFIVEIIELFKYLGVEDNIMEYIIELIEYYSYKNRTIREINIYMILSLEIFIEMIPFAEFQYKYKHSIPIYDR